MDSSKITKALDIDLIDLKIESEPAKNDDENKSLKDLVEIECPPPPKIRSRTIKVPDEKEKTVNVNTAPTKKAGM